MNYYHRIILRLSAVLGACCSIIYADLPSGWTAQDVGAPGQAGSASQTYGTWTVSGGGAAIGDRLDQFYFVSRTLQGNGTVAAYVDTVGSTNDWAKSGVMIRESTDADAAFGCVVVTPANSVLFQWRSATGESVQSLSAGGIVSGPVWVRLSRCGNTLAAEFSYDGAHWVQIGQPEPVASAASALAGLAVCAGDDEDLSSATFSGVGVLPLQWENSNIGGSVVRGSTTFDGGRIVMSGRGLTGYSSDQFHFACQPCVGDMAVVAKVERLSGGGATAKAGVMIREDTAVGARYAFSYIAPNEETANFECRTAENSAGISAGASSDIPAPYWIKLVRRENIFTAYRSGDGIVWTQNGAPMEVEMGATVRVGLALASGGGTMAEATFSNVQVELPEWSGVDIGEPACAGSVQFDGLSWQVNGGGADLWGTSDQFHFVRRHFTGDVVIVAKINSLLETATWTKAGLMIRESAGGDSRHAAVYTRLHDSTMEFRSETGGETQSAGSISGAITPRWLKLERVDDLFTASESTNGMDWVQIGNATVAMNSTVQVGLAVCANDDSQLNSAVFSDVSVSTYYRSPFLCANGMYFKNQHGAGDAVPLRGSNIGAWMMHEEWLNGMDTDNYGSSVLISEDFILRDTLETRFGTALANRIIAQFEDYWFTELDLDNMRALGLNVLRVPFSYRCLIDSDDNWRSDAFTQLDWVVDEAWKRGIYTVLDLHGAPGGASPFYSSGLIGGGALWTNDSLQELAVELWEGVAEHYAGHPGVAGYDLLNEPVPPSTDALNALYDEMYEAIRAVDPDHCIIMGAGGGEAVGGYWSINTLPAPSEMGWTNVAYQSHSYATTTNTNPQGEAQWQVWQHESHPNVPMLVGEFNLGSEQAYGVQLWDDNAINWTTWCFKARYGNEALHWGIYKGNTWPLTPDLDTDSAESILATYAAAAPTEGNYSLDERNAAIYGTPLPEDDMYSTAPETALYVAPVSGVLVNDLLSDTGSAERVDGPWHGSLSLWDDGSLYYEPDEGFSGTDGFRYSVQGATNESSRLATVYLLVEEQPVLSIAGGTNGTVCVSWPEWADGLECRLVTQTNLVSSNEWESAAVDSVLRQSNAYIVTLPEASAARFYKLEQP